MKKPLVALIALSFLLGGCAAAQPDPASPSESATVAVIADITASSSLTEMLDYASQITPAMTDARERVRKAAQLLQDAHDLPSGLSNTVNQDLTSLNADTFDGDPEVLVKELNRIVQVIKNGQ